MRLRLLIAAATLALAAGSCLPPSTGQCRTDEDCLAGATCENGLCTGGEVPFADIVAPTDVALGGVVTLDGSGSRRADGQREGLVYEWAVLEPGDVELEGSTSATPKLRATVPHATYRVHLVVRDQGTASAPVEHLVTVRNSAPIARLESVEEWLKDATFEVSAASSSDPDGDALTYTWSLVQVPANAGATITPEDGGKAMVKTGLASASYTVRVVVSDGHGGTSEATIERAANNRPPSINPGDAFTVDHTCTGTAPNRTCTASGRLNGAVADPDGSIKSGSVAWRLVSSPPGANLQSLDIVPVSGAGAVSNFRLTNAATDPIAGSYEFELFAEDNEGLGNSARVVVTVGNRAPTIALTADTALTQGHTNDDETDEFVASFPIAIEVSDPDGDELTTTFHPLAPGLEGATVTVEVLEPSRAVYVVRVARTNPLSLIDPAATEALYTALLSVTDVNGTRAEVEAPFEITNRPPVLIAFDDVTSDGHTYGTLPRGGNGYLGRFPMNARLVDPDGDPIVAEWAVTGVAPLDFDVVGDPAAPTRLDVFSTSRDVVGADLGVKLAFGDPFENAEEKRTFRIGARDPVIKGFAGRSLVGHAYGGVVGQQGNFYYQSYPLSVEIHDPDNTPLSVEWSVSGAEGAQVLVVGPANAPTGLMIYSKDMGIVGKLLAVTVTARDEFGGAEVTEVFRMTNRAPVIEKMPDSLTSVGHRYGTVQGLSNRYYETWPGAPSGSPTAVSISITDPDGDPLDVVWDVIDSAPAVTDRRVWTSPSATSVSQLTVAGNNSAFVTNPGRVRVRVTDGVAEAEATSVLKLANRAPTFTSVDAEKTFSAGTPFEGSCFPPASCVLFGGFGGCINGPYVYSTPGSASFGAFGASATPFDPDGDPLTGTWTLGDSDSGVSNLFQPGNLSSIAASCTTGVRCPLPKHDVYAAGGRSCTGSGVGAPGNRLTRDSQRYTLEVVDPFGRSATAELAVKIQ